MPPTKLLIVSLLILICLSPFIAAYLMGERKNNPNKKMTAMEIRKAYRKQLRKKYILTTDDIKKEFNKKTKNPISISDSKKIDKESFEREVKRWD